MAAQFGGNAFRGNEKIDMPNGIKDFFKVFIPSGGSSDTPMGEQTNIYGNHLGSWNFSLTGMLHRTGRFVLIMNIILRIIRRCSENMVGRIAWLEWKLLFRRIR